MSNQSRGRRVPRRHAGGKSGLPFIISLVIGDWSHDGHERTSEHLIFSNLSRDDVKAAYAAGVGVIGVDLSETIAVEYEDGCLPEAAWQKYVAAGIADFGWEVESGLDPGVGISLDPEAFLDLYLLTVLRGNPKFRYEHDNTIEIMYRPEYGWVLRHKGVEVASKINIGGYGLFG